jgi:hypothetical protein
LSGVTAAILGVILLLQVGRPHGSGGYGIDGGLGLAIVLIAGLFLVGLGALSLPHLLQAILYFRTGRFRTGWSRGVSLVHTLLWVLVSVEVSSPRELGYFLSDNDRPWAISVAVGITLIHGLATIASFRLKEPQS